MSTHLRRIQVILAICVCAQLSQAAPVSYLQAPRAGGEGFFSGGPPDDQQMADNFSFAQLTQVTSVRWWGTYLTNPPPGADSFTVRFFATDVGGVPQLDPSNEFTGLAITRTNSGLMDELGGPIYQYEAQLPSGVVIAAQAIAYFSVLNDTSNRWYWQESTISGSNWVRNFEGAGATWILTTTGHLAFQLIGNSSPQGDYNVDFMVTQADYTRWRQNFGSTTQLAADGNSNGRVDAADYVIWRRNLQTGTANGISLAAVPEPSSVVLILAAGLIMLLGKRSGTYPRNRMAPTIESAAGKRTFRVIRPQDAAARTGG